MFLFTLVLLFLPEADTLKCYECLSSSPGICTGKTTECPSQDYRCSAVTTEVAIKDGVVVPIVNFKGCMMPELCVENSVNYGTYKVVKNSVCCNGDLCNAQIPEYKSTPNGKKCFTCEGENCMKTLKCEGNENYCVTATRAQYEGKNVTLKGCASKLICSNQRASRVNQFSTEQLSCCQGDYCNSASRAFTYLLLLLVPLLFSNLFS
ncbi:urokinase plasminogen activator surface receptor-like [Xiphophorus maculatus]|uniref:urokinase plasminogen activator surface receptor-like n=1 Tax=Xiphophorus maculatus TaxID=8083 RepID=UPI000C6D86BC|nr:urokinase plasminogen activator surface receptor-like [Xiphophorus maculatus]